jgi:hypothetical protein
MLREADLHLPKKGWGRIDLAASASRAGTAWTDHGTARQECGLKHPADNETRTIPIPPELVRLLRATSSGTGRPQTGDLPLDSQDNGQDPGEEGDGDSEPAA